MVVARMAMEMIVMEWMEMEAMPVIATAMAMPLMATAMAMPLMATMHANGINN